MLVSLGREQGEYAVQPTMTPALRHSEAERKPLLLTI